MATNKGFIKDYQGNILLPITRGELILDSTGNLALTSAQFEAGRSINGVKNEYGLISAAERAMISGGGEGQGIQDIYNKLGFINSAITVGSNTLSFYDESGTTPVKTPIVLEGTANQIAVSTLSNTIKIALAETETGALSASQIIKSITVDKYGRVTAVSGSALLDSEIPTTLTGKTLESATIDSTSKLANKDISTLGEDAIASKYYVDQQFKAVNQVATGALTFGGALSTKTGAEAKLDKQYENHYYKVTADFELDSTDLYESSISDRYGKTVKKGDSLIVYNDSGVYRFVHIPSGDDITTITIQEGTNAVPDVNNRMIGDVTFRFNDVFDITYTGQTASISLPNVSSSSVGGYLSRTDYNSIMNAVSNLGKTKYTSTVLEAAAGLYEIGKITVGDEEYVVNGINNISSLTLENGASGTVNPILKFTETGTGGSVKNITIEGSNGVKAEKSGDVIKLTGTYIVGDNSASYLQIQGNVIDAKFGSGSGDAITEGLVKYSDFEASRADVNTLKLIAQNAQPIILTGSLVTGATGSDSKTYSYGSDALKDAVAI